MSKRRFASKEVVETAEAMGSMHYLSRVLLSHNSFQAQRSLRATT